MRDLLEPEVDRWRLRDWHTVSPRDDGDAACGAFLVRGGGVALLVVASSGGAWDHVLVSTRNRTPSWDEMERVRKLFFKADEVVVQYGVPAAMRVDFHKHTLHWWRPHDGVIPLPPRWLIAPVPGWEEAARAARAVTRG